MKLLDSLPEEGLLQSNLYGNIIHCDNNLVVCPTNAKKIWLYNLKRKKWEFVSLDKEEEEIPYKFFGGYAYGNKIYMFGCYYPGIICLNVETKQLTRINKPFENILHQGEYDGLFNSAFTIIDKCLYAAILRTNQIMKFRLDTEECEFISIGSIKNRYSGVIWDGENMWLPPRKNGSYAVWDGKNCVKEYSLPEGFERDTYYFGGGYYINGRVIFAGFNGKSLEISVNAPEKAKVINKNILCYRKFENKIISYIEDGIIQMESEEQIVLQKECGLENGVLDKIFQAEWNNKKIETRKNYYETTLRDLKCWIAITVKKKVTEDNQKRQDLGLKIYNRL